MHTINNLLNGLWSGGSDSIRLVRNYSRGTFHSSLWFVFFDFIAECLSVDSQTNCWIHALMGWWRKKLETFFLYCSSHSRSCILNCQADIFPFRLVMIVTSPWRKRRKNRTALFVFRECTVRIRRGGNSICLSGVSKVYYKIFLFLSIWTPFLLGRFYPPGRIEP